MLPRRHVAAIVIALAAHACGDSHDATRGAASRIWAVGQTAKGAVILRSDDLGEGWSTVFAAPMLTLSAVSFSDQDHGWAAGSAILRTEDGGSTWRVHENIVPVDPRPLGPFFFDVAARDARTGIAVGETFSPPDRFTRSIAVQTGDGGMTWTALASATRADNAFLEAVCVGNDGTAVAVGGAGFNSVTSISFALSSDDAGATWQDVRGDLRADGVGFLEGSFRDVACGPDGELWIVGRDLCQPFCDSDEPSEPLMIFRSRDGGVKWEEQSAEARREVAETNSGLQAVAFVEGNRGWVAGFTGDDDDRRALVLRTADAGAHWERRDLPGDPTGTLDAVAFATADVGIVAGRSGEDRPLLFATRNGGRRWTAVALPPDVKELADVGIVRTDE